MATRRARNNIVTNIVARLEAEDNASPELKKATEEGRNLAEASRRVIRQFQRMDNHSAAVSKNIKSIRDASLRARVAMETMRGTFAGNVSTLDRLEDKLTLVKIKLDNMGAAGTLVRKGLAALKVAALAAAAAIGASFVTAIRDMGEFSGGAERANTRLEESLKRFNIAIVSAATGIDKHGKKVGEWADAVDNATKVVDHHSDELFVLLDTWTDMFPGLLALKAGYNELKDATIEYDNELAESIRLSKEHIKFTDELTKRQTALNRLIAKQKKEGFGFVPAPGKTPGEIEDEAAAARAKARSTRRSRGGGRSRKQELVVDLSMVRAAEMEEAKRNEARVRRENAEAIKAELEALLEQANEMAANAEVTSQLSRLKADMAAAFEDAAKAQKAFRESVIALELDATRQSISLVTDALGDMITAMVSGEKVAGNFGAVFAERFGTIVMQTGKAAIALAAISTLMSTGAFGFPGGAALLAGAGGAALVGGAVLRGLAKRGQATMSGGGVGGAASAAAQDAINTVAANTTRGRDEGPSESVIVVDGNPMRAWVVNTFAQAAELGEMPTVPVRAL